MKSFLVGMLVTFCGFLIYQNHVLHQKLAKTNKEVIQKKKTKKNKQVVQTDDVPYWEKKDPRCPSHLPYWAGERWGCVVKPIDPFN